MKLSITEEEGVYLLKVIGADQKELRSKLTKIRKRKKSNYKKCIATQKENFKVLEEIIKVNYKVENVKLIKKLGISKATFYRVYSEKAKELKKLYKSQSLF